MRMEITAKKTKLVESYEQVKEKAGILSKYKRQKRHLGNARRSIVKTKQNCIKHINLPTGTFSKRNARRDARGLLWFLSRVREALKARENRLQGIEGAVAELLTVPKEYEIAMEIALGAAMQHIVVQKKNMLVMQLRF